MNQKDKTLIPKGVYCYHDSRGERCPYWSSVSGRENQEDGYCSFLGKGDYEINREVKEYEITRYEGDKEIKSIERCGPDNPDCFSLLWDQVKCCGINEYTDEDWEQMFPELKDKNVD